METSCGLMDLITKENFSTTIFMAKAITNGLMVDSTMGIGKRTKWMGKENSYGLMAGNITGNIWTTRSTGMESFNGLMEESTKECGQMESNMERAHTKQKMGR
jgi:hypothetical protein